MVCDGLKGLSDPIGDVWPQALVQTCLQLLRGSSRQAGRQRWDAVAKALKRSAPDLPKQPPGLVRQVHRGLGRPAGAHDHGVPQGGYAVSYTEMWFWLSELNGVRCQSLWRSRSRSPASCAMRSSSLGQA